MNFDELAALTKNDVPLDLFYKCVSAVNFVKNNYLDKVTGIWLLKRLSADDEPRIVLQTSVQLKTTEYIYLEGGLSKCFGGCVVFDYNEDVLNADTNEELLMDIREEIKYGEAYSLYVI